MPKLTQLLQTEEHIILGPTFGLEIHDRVNNDRITNPDKAKGVLDFKYIGPGCSALLS